VAKHKVGRYPLEFRRMVVERMRNSTNIFELSRELGVNRSLMYIWRGQLEATPAGETPERGEASEDPRDTKLREENAVLKRALAEKGLEVDFFKGALQKIAARRQASTSSGERASTTKSGK
jgi:transposase-like protein